MHLVVTFWAQPHLVQDVQDVRVELIFGAIPTFDAREQIHMLIHCEVGDQHIMLKTHTLLCINFINIMIHTIPIDHHLTRGDGEHPRSTVKCCGLPSTIFT